MRRGIVGVVIAVLVSMATTGVVAQEPTEPEEDTVRVGLAPSTTPTIDVTVELSQATFADGSADTVLIGRDDLFADSLASGVAQDGAPLLLVPTAGPVPAQVMAEISRLGATRAVVFGGESAVSPQVVDQLSAAGLAVERRSGASRIETAVAVAGADAPAATTAILARAGGIEGNPTSAFADALAAGGWSAATGWPVLLTQTDVLTGSTRDYLASAAITDVQIVGGTLAVGDAVAAELRDMGLTVERVAGPDRAATALEIAAKRGADGAADVARVVVVDGFSDDAWAAGFAAAARSAMDDAPVVLANVDALAPATEAWLEPGPVQLTCATTAEVCEAARLAIGFAPALQVDVAPGTVTFTVSDATTSLLWTADVDGSDPGLGYSCGQVRCGEPDWTASGQRLYAEVREEDGGEVLGILALTGSRLERTNGGALIGDQPLTALNADDRLAAAFLPEAVAFNQPTFGAIASRLDPGSGMYNTGRLGRATFPSYQALNDHPLSGGNDIALLILETNQELSVYIDNGGGAPAHIQRRPGSAVLGAAWAGDGGGDIAITDELAGVGVLRISPYPGEEVLTVEGLDVSSVPVWTPDGDAVMVLADTAEGVSLVRVDSTTGAATVLVEDAGDAAGGRISIDASGTLVAWRAADEIRVLNTADGTVATLDAPEGFEVVAGPAFRP